MLNTRRSKFIFVSIIFLHIHINNAYAWNLFGPNNFNECVQKNMQGVSSDAAASAIVFTCRQQFPQVEQREKSPALRIGTPRLDVWDKPYNSRVFGNISVGKFRPNQYGALEVIVTNKNEFDISGIYVGILRNKRGNQCSIAKDDYSEIYECSGDLSANTTRTMYCSGLKGGGWCVVGFKGTQQMDVDKFFQDIYR